jgi:hypothetical protein
VTSDAAAPSLAEGVPFAIQALDHIQHGAFSRWVKVGIASAAGAYALVTVLGVVTRGFTALAVFTQGATVGLCLLALWLAFDDRLEIAAALTIGAIWLELHGGLLSTGMVLSSTIAMPTVIVAAGLLWVAVGHMPWPGSRPYPSQGWRSSVTSCSGLLPSTVDTRSILRCCSLS